MNDTHAHTPAPHRFDGVASLRNAIETWRSRASFRWELEQMATDDPRLIDDIGLDMREVGKEIAKHFWQR